MRTNHAHVEAAMVALLLFVVVAVVDIWVDIADGQAFKVPGYFVGFIVVYAIARMIFNRLWSS